MLAIDDMTDVSRSLMRMPKDVVGGGCDRRWPQPGQHEHVELQSDVDRSIKLYIDVYEGRRTTMLLSADVDRKPTFQARGHTLGSTLPTTHRLSGIATQMARWS